MRSGRQSRLAAACGRVASVLERQPDPPRVAIDTPHVGIESSDRPLERSTLIQSESAQIVFNSGTPGIQDYTIGSSGTYELVIIDMHPQGAVYWREPAVVAVAQVHAPWA